MKNSWDRAVDQQKITTSSEENVIHQRTTYIPTSLPYAPCPPNLKTKKKVYCLYRSHTCMNRTCVSPRLYRYLPAPEDRPILPSFRASALKKKPANFKKAKFCLCRSW